MRETYVSYKIVRAQIEHSLGPLKHIPGHRPDESRNHRIHGSKGVIGFISPVSEPYCGNCNRMRLTADGKFPLCLLNDDELDVRAAIRGGGGEAAVRDILVRAVRAKPTGHELRAAGDVVAGRSTEVRRMHAIGG